MNVFARLLGSEKAITSAAAELLSSRYAKQIGKRADNLAELLLTI